MKTLPLAALGLALALAGCMTPPRETVRREAGQPMVLGRERPQTLFAEQGHVDREGERTKP